MLIPKQDYLFDTQTKQNKAEHTCTKWDNLRSSFRARARASQPANAALTGASVCGSGRRASVDRRLVLREQTQAEEPKKPGLFPYLKELEMLTEMLTT